MSWVAVAVGAGTAIYGASQQKKASKDASKAQQQGTQLGVDEQRRQFDLTRTDQQPWMQAGTSALGQMQALNRGDFSSFTQSPDYQFAYDQGLQGLDRGAAARGRMFSGGYDADRMKFASGLASQNYGTYYSRLSDLATGGNATAGRLGAMGMGMANSLGTLWNNAADARASSYQQRGDTNTQLAGIIGGGINQGYQYNQARNGGGSGFYFGNNPGRG